jgi:hypothetical protein
LVPGKIPSITGHRKVSSRCSIWGRGP